MAQRDQQQNTCRVQTNADVDGLSYTHFHMYKPHKCTVSVVPLVFVLSKTPCMANKSDLQLMRDLQAFLLLSIQKCANDGYDLNLSSLASQD